MNQRSASDGEVELSILGRSWSFGRGDGSVIAGNIRLLRDGTILGHKQRNESAWRVSEGALEFLDAAGNVTCRFDSQTEERGSLTLTGRFRPLADCVHVLKETRRLIKRGSANREPRVAMLVRTHLVNDKLFDLLDLLNQSRRYDLFVTADETRQTLDLRGYVKLTHAADFAQAFGLPHSHGRILWHCGDFPLYFAAAERPDYDYYIMMEYDVDLVRKSPLFLEGLIARLADEDRAVDLVTVNLGRAYQGWSWATAALRTFPAVYTTGTFAFLVVSRRAVAHLLAARRREAVQGVAENDIMHCEAFCASALMDGGFACTSVNALIENAVDRESFHPGSFDKAHSSFLLNHYRLDDPRIEMVHPVYALPAFLSREYHKTLRTQAFAEFLERLPLPARLNEHDGRLVARYRQEIMGRVSTAANP